MLEELLKLNIFAFFLIFARVGAVFMLLPLFFKTQTYFGFGVYGR